MTPSFERVVQQLRRLPGVGRKTATKYAYALLRQGKDAMNEVAAALQELADRTIACEQCYNWTEASPCAICSDRVARQICVVEQPGDILAIERSGHYRGQYHVLHGVLDPVQGIGLDEITVDALVQRVERQKAEELILALSPTREGEATSHLIVTMLAAFDVDITRLAHGVPLGGQLEYLDEATLGMAMAHRRNFYDDTRRES